VKKDVLGTVEREGEVGGERRVPDVVYPLKLFLSG
jgi:hypothetical protein